MSNIQRERYVWLFILIFGVVIWRVIIPAQIQTNENYSNYGPEFFPNLLAITIITISFISLLLTFFNKTKGSKASEEQQKQSDQGKLSNGIIVFGITVAYVFLVDIIHFVPASIISMLLIMWVLSVKRWYFYLIMISIIFIINYVFENIMYIQLP
ncbi:tripartite tricarboxylate transporter TctB family protein [Virgibacillus sp. CBA3643]|uniref:tripartite tricarboxylate transporter TctB family protein n=1 Tax=Virgibacillus sp. CBA3643 TaxID=2942278 RepID=UPI0035A3A4FC